jgi:benzoylformate decarboxylase
MTNQRTVQEVTYDLLRALGLTTVFGNPGSTEETFLKNFPDDLTYVLGLQEASVLAMADGFAQSTGKPALVNVHTSAGTGNAMGNLIAAYKGNTPLIVTAGQQTREMVLCDPYLTNKDATLLPLPWVKWAYEPARAEDVPAAFMRAYAMALQPPAGPVYLSIPLDDWDKPALGPAVVRTISHRVRMPRGCASSRSASTPRRPRWWCLVRRWIGPAPGTPGWPSPRRWAHPCTTAHWAIECLSRRITTCTGDRCR